MSDDSGEMRWLPLESNPEVMNPYIENLGASKDWSFHDVYGLDPDLLMMVPRPVAAVMMLYPITEKSEETRLGTETANPDIYFMKQTVGNACGTVGIIHALANNRDRITLAEDSALVKFLAASQTMTSEEKASALGNDKNIGAAHESSAKEGQTEAPDVSAKTNLHFVAFIHSQGGLYEMDGRRENPIRHGDTTPNTLLEDTVEVVKKFVARDPSELNFTLTALCKSY